MEDLLSVLFSLCANQRMTLIGSVRSCWHFYIYFFFLLGLCAYRKRDNYWGWR